jgi:hypothetical protein
MITLGKIVTAGIGLVTGTALLTGVTTAYILRPQAPSAPPTETYTTTPVPRASAAMTAARVVPAVSRPTANPPRAVPVASTSSQCDTGGDRALRIAKPGVIGALLGAGLGAAGGAIADGGPGAGKGALIGGLVGVATGAGYGAYKTNNECGTIFGNRGFTDGVPGVSERGAATDAALRQNPGNDITVYSAR